jgi:hypothetical protein
MLRLRQWFRTKEDSFPGPAGVHGYWSVHSFILHERWLKATVLGAASTIPAAYQMIVRMFPDPKEQGLAMAAFGSTVAIANSSSYLKTSLHSHLDLFLCSGRPYARRYIHPISKLALDFLDYRDHCSHYCIILLDLYSKYPKACSWAAN